jgi:hypothetical protein
MAGNRQQSEGGHKNVQSSDGSDIAVEFVTDETSASPRAVSLCCVPRSVD